MIGRLVVAEVIPNIVATLCGQKLTRVTAE